MFTITKNSSVSALNISVKTDEHETFQLVPLTPHELPVNMTNLVVHAPGYEVETVPNASGLYVFFFKNNTLGYQHFN